MIGFPGARAEARRRLSPYSLSVRPALFVLGSFDTSVTVLGQQVRALNLACALIESGTVPTLKERRKSIAIVGAGFAGLTLAAALLKKEAALDITLFEERDTLLPLQQGSDSRWLHPRIYDWPADGSEASSGMLPILNWTAARASDVVVQVIGEWAVVVGEANLTNRSLQLYCNTRHLQIDPCPHAPGKSQVEWVGEKRLAEDGGSSRLVTTTGQSASFDLVVMAVGFGLEQADPLSYYWRNESYGQPSLSHTRATWLVSGQGDGAMIDLLRLRISQYRQDRILEELFQAKPALLKSLRDLRSDVESGAVRDGLFERFEAIATHADSREEWGLLEVDLKRRLRRDTEVVLHLLPEVRNLAGLFAPGRRRMSFQNALLVYLLYRCGGFAPSCDNETNLRKRLGIRDEHVVRRHGPDRIPQFTRILAPKFQSRLNRDKLRQSAEVNWKGGYFGFPGRLDQEDEVEDADREWWRKEHLPGATALVGTTVAGAVAGALRALRPHANHDRITLHRVLDLNRETLLQQTCDYLGRTEPPNRRSATGRTFPKDMATIGLAFACRRPVRSIKGVSRQDLEIAMDRLQLKKSARNMAEQVEFVLAIPVLQPLDHYAGPSPVAAVLYLDSRSAGYWLEDDEVAQICRVVEDGFRGLERPFQPFERLRNVFSSEGHVGNPLAAPIPSDVQFALELVEAVDPPRTKEPFQLNYGVSDLTPLPLPVSGD